jgi:hypothetical protein
MLTPRLPPPAWLPHSLPISPPGSLLDSLPVPPVVAALADPPLEPAEEPTRPVQRVESSRNSKTNARTGCDNYLSTPRGR